MAGQILSGTHTSPSTHDMHVSNVPLKSRACSKASEDFGFSETRHANGNGFKAPMPKRNPVSVGTVSSVGKKYMWRPRSSENSNGSKPLKVDARESSIGGSTDHSLVSSDANSGIPKESAYRKDTNYLNEDVENFLFEMLGRGFQLERSAIREVLGRCGYDMKQSLETLLDLSAASLDKRNDLYKGSNLHSVSETFSSQNQVHKQNIAESSRFGNNGLRSRQSNGRYEQQKDILTALFRAPERPVSTVSASSKVSGRRPRESGRVVAEPLEDISDLPEAIYTLPPLAHPKDEAEDNAYQILRKAVKEHRDTMKEYYRAATEAFANGDRALAALLMEKGRFFCNKAREADEESASKIFDISGDDETQDDMSLDLQDHQAKEAIQLLKSHLRSLSGIPSIKNLKVMIGNGGKDAERRKRVIIKLLEREAITWIEDENSNTILINLEEINPASLSFAKK